LAESSLGLERFDIFKVSLDGITELVRDRVVALSIAESNRWSFNGLSSLDIFSSNFSDISIVSSVSSDELSDDSEW